MRKILLLICLLSGISRLCSAQVGRPAGQFNLELGGNYYAVDEDESYYDMYGPSLSIGGGVRLCDYLYLGVVTGGNIMIDQGKNVAQDGEIVNKTWYRKYLFPMALNMRGYIPMSRYSPFHLHIDVAAGPLCSYEQYYYVEGFSFKGFHVRTGIGVSAGKFSFTMGWEKFRRQDSIYLRAGITLGKYTRK